MHFALPDLEVYSAQDLVRLVGDGHHVQVADRQDAIVVCGGLARLAGWLDECVGHGSVVFGVVVATGLIGMSAEW